MTDSTPKNAAIGPSFDESPEVFQGNIAVIRDEAEAIARDFGITVSLCGGSVENPYSLVLGSEPGKRGVSAFNSGSMCYGYLMGVRDVLLLRQGGDDEAL